MTTNLRALELRSLGQQTLAGIDPYGVVSSAEVASDAAPPLVEQPAARLADEDALAPRGDLRPPPSRTAHASLTEGTRSEARALSREPELRAVEGAKMSDQSTDGSEPKPPVATEDARYARAWRVWLEALAHDPEAAWAAALTYRSLDVAGREAWIGALDIDAPDVGAPAIALYAPLLAVEDDPARRARLEATLLQHGAPAPTEVLRGLRGDAPRVGDGASKRRIVVLVHPLYLNFVEVLICHLDGERGFGDVRHDPIRLAEQAPVEGDVIDGAELEAVPVEPLIEELAHAIVAHRRAHNSLPPSLARFVDLFAPRPESVDRLRLNDP